MKEKNLLEALREGLGLVHQENKVSNVHVDGTIHNSSIQSESNEETSISDCVINELHWSYFYLQNTHIVITRTVFTNTTINIKDCVLKTKHKDKVLSIINDSTYKMIDIENSLIDGLFIENSKNAITICLKDCIFTKDVVLLLKKKEISKITLENCIFINGAKFVSNGTEDNIDLTIDTKTARNFNELAFTYKVK
ncbi:MAG: hypothetical protein WCQ32_03125 [bacterium]